MTPKKPTPKFKPTPPCPNQTTPNTHTSTGITRITPVFFSPHCSPTPPVYEKRKK